MAFFTSPADGAALWAGAPAADALIRTARARADALRARGVTPRLALVRIGAQPGDLAYERGAQKRCAAAGVEAETVVLPEDVSADALIAHLRALSADPAVHGCLLFRPLPARLRAREDAIRGALAPEKDVDGMTDLSLAGVFSGRPLGFAPCTARACLALLDHYGADCAGMRAVVIGRSLVIGRPIALLLLARDATVTLCHTKTRDLPALTQEADLIVTAAGAPASLTRAHVRPGQIVLDVSVNAGPQGLCGDAVFDEVAPVVGAITPVPGGVGAVTSAVLALHTVEAAERAAGAKNL